MGRRERRRRRCQRGGLPVVAIIAGVVGVRWSSKGVSVRVCGINWLEKCAGATSPYERVDDLVEIFIR